VASFASILGGLKSTNSPLHIFICLSARLVFSLEMRILVTCTHSLLLVTGDLGTRY